MPFARAGFEELYVKPAQKFEQQMQVLKTHGLARVWSPYALNSAGPSNSALLDRVEVTYGEGLLPSARYSVYMEAIAKNPSMLNGLGVTHALDPRDGSLVSNPAPIGRVTAPKTVIFVPDRARAQAALEGPDFNTTAVVEAPARSLSTAPVSVELLDYRGDYYRVRYQSEGEALIRFAVPYFTGWKADVNGSALAVLAVDEALCGVIVPPGTHEIVLQYAPPRFTAAAVASGATALLTLLGLL